MYPHKTVVQTNPLTQQRGVASFHIYKALANLYKFKYIHLLYSCAECAYTFYFKVK